MQDQLSRDALLDLRSKHIEAGRLAVRARQGLFGPHIEVRAIGHSPGRRPEAASIVRHGDWIDCDEWPAPQIWHNDDHVVVRVEPEDATRWATYLPAPDRKVAQGFVFRRHGCARLLLLMGRETRITPRHTGLIRTSPQE